MIGPDDLRRKLWELYSESERVNESFETLLLTMSEDLMIRLANFLPFEPAEFHLPPWYLPGSDFLMRWSQGRWAEHLSVWHLPKHGSLTK